MIQRNGKTFTIFPTSNQKKIKRISTDFEIQAGLTSLVVKFHSWEWEEEVRKLYLEDIGLGKTNQNKSNIQSSKSWSPVGLMLIFTNFISSSDNQCCRSWNITYCFCD